MRAAGAVLRGPLEVGRIIGSAPRAEYRQIVDLAFLGMHQDHAAFPAGKTNLVIAGIKKWRGADQAFVPWPRDRAETDFADCRHGGSL
jgi:hypothetical protein